MILRLSFPLTILMMAGAASSETHSPPKQSAAAREISLDWSLRRDGSNLVIDYTIRNHLDKPIEIADAVTDYGFPRPSRVLVGMEEFFRDDPKQNRIVFAKEPWRPVMPTDRKDSPAILKTIQPGGLYHKSATVSIPLKSWGPNGDAMPLQKKTRDVVLLIYYWLEGKERNPRGCDDDYIIGKTIHLPDYVTIDDSTYHSD